MTATAHRPDTLTATVVANVRSARKARGMTVQDLSDATAASGHRVPHGAITKLENGYRAYLTVTELHMLAAALGIDDPWTLTTQTCDTCHGAPPAGYACLTCGTKGGTA